MTVFVDTSALFAVLVPGDAAHDEARRVLATLRAERARLATHNYVVLETAALVQRRAGVDAVRALHDGLLAVVDVAWVDEEMHRSAYAALAASRRRDVSLVDRVSFELMRRCGIEVAFAYDEHFAAEGFRTL